MKKSKKLLIAAIVGISCIVIQPVKVKAALQSNGGTPAKYNINQWITGIRQMQEAGGALGLTDTIDGTNLTSDNKNLDIHLQKNTEYGALVILSASAYGNPNKIESNGTTTGNATGVVMQINKEWTAAGTSTTDAVSMRNAAGRYKNKYTAPTYTAKVGDGIETVGTWHGATGNAWLGSNASFAMNRDVLLRSYSGSVFSYYGWGYQYVKYEDIESERRDGNYIRQWSSRAVVVVGSGV